ncbi:hypothetical protein CBS101457_001734 [Exobasidium rhododendri]|nr:hypothetical protein CBS101457_001734 [Exobasidium rhododendri]
MTVPKSFRQLGGATPSSVSVSSGTTALIVIDPQKSYASGAPLAISQVETRQKVISGIVDEYRKAKAPIVWVQHSAGKEAPVFNPSNESFDWIDLKPEQGEKAIVKEAPSCFTGTDFHEYLQSKGIKQVVLTGYMAHVCVTGTARSSMEHGYDVVVVKDAIGDRDIPSLDGKSTVTADTLVDMVCTELGDFCGTVVNSSEIKA